MTSRGASAAGSFLLERRWRVDPLIHEAIWFGQNAARRRPLEPDATVATELQLLPRKHVASFSESIPHPPPASPRNFQRSPREKCALIED